MHTPQLFAGETDAHRARTRLPEAGSEWPTTRKQPGKGAAVRFPVRSSAWRLGIAAFPALLPPFLLVGGA
ncbi:hypothetical protein MRX96_019357 [Rhipicephalus microplus]